MRKLSIMILLLITIIITFTGCGKSDEQLCKDVVKNFSMDMYNESYDDLEKIYLSLAQIDTKEEDEKLKEFLSYFEVYNKYFTDKGFDSTIKNRMFSYHHNYLIDNQKNIKFKDIKFNDIIKTESDYNNKEFIKIKYTVTFELLNKDGTVYKKFDDNLFATLTLNDDEWKINYFMMSPFKMLEDR